MPNPATPYVPQYKWVLEQLNLAQKDLPSLLQKEYQVVEGLEKVLNSLDPDAHEKEFEAMSKGLKRVDAQFIEHVYDLPADTWKNDDTDGVELTRMELLDLLYETGKRKNILRSFLFHNGIEVPVTAKTVKVGPYRLTKLTGTTHKYNLTKPG